MMDGKRRGETGGKRGARERFDAFYLVMCDGGVVVAALGAAGVAWAVATGAADPLSYDAPLSAMFLGAAMKALGAVARGSEAAETAARRRGERAARAARAGRASGRSGADGIG